MEAPAGLALRKPTAVAATLGWDAQPHSAPGLRRLCCFGSCLLELPVVSGQQTESRNQRPARLENPSASQLPDALERDFEQLIPVNI